MLNNIKSFGLNVIPEHKRTVEQTAETVGEAISGMWEPIFDYLKANDNVFSGEVEKEITKIQGQTMRLGMTMDSVAEKRNINFQS